MSLQNVMDFGRKAIADEALSKELVDTVGAKQGTEAAAAAAQVATRHGYPCTAEEVAEGYEQAMKADGVNAPAGEISDDDLEAIAGGISKSSANLPRDKWQNPGVAPGRLPGSKGPGK
jgi:hypothetical protein